MTSSTEVDQALKAGRDLNAWWAGVESGQHSVDRGELVRAFPGGDAVTGFFGEAQVAGKTVPVMGYTGDYFFDLARTASNSADTAAWMAGQVEEFALGYWLRTEAWASPQPYPSLSGLTPPAYLRFLSMRPSDSSELPGTANRQRAFQLRATGQTGEFPATGARDIVDLRELENRYEWITLERRMRDIDLRLAALGANSASLTLPLSAVRELAISSDLIVRKRGESQDVAGEFGFGYVPMNVPGGDPRNALLNAIQPGFRIQTLRVLRSAEVRLRMVTIMARPGLSLQALLDPVTLGVNLADRLTLGLASRLTNDAPVEHVEQHLLAENAIRLRDSLLGTRASWQQASDWLDHAALPAWLEKGSPEKGSSAKEPLARGAVV